MNHYQTTGIVLSRIDYGEADRILTFLTPDHGKVSALAKGVRKVKSKLAGGVELFTINDIVIIEGKSDLQTLRSARMKQNFGYISQNYSRLQLGFQMLKMLSRISEPQVESGYFDLLQTALDSLNDPDIQPAITQLWFSFNFLQLQGRQPNLSHDTADQELKADAEYNYIPEESGLELRTGGALKADHIKLARLCLQYRPGQVMQVKQAAELSNDWLRQLRLIDPT